MIFQQKLRVIGHGYVQRESGCVPVSYVKGTAGTFNQKGSNFKQKIFV
jgi:hypothetical protein